MLSAVVVWRATHMPTCRKMRSMIYASLISDTMRISCWRWDVIGAQRRIDLQDFLDTGVPARSDRNTTPAVIPQSVKSSTSATHRMKYGTKDAAPA